MLAYLARSRRSLLPIDTRPPLHQYRQHAFHATQDHEELRHEARQRLQVYERTLEFDLLERGYVS